MPSRVKLALGIEREIIKDKISQADKKKKRGRPAGIKNVKSSKNGSSKKSKNQTEAGDGGKSFYCNSTTGVTQRTVPQSEDLKIHSQDESEVFQKKLQESGAASKDDGDKDGVGEDFQEEIQECEAASKDDGDKAGEDLQEEKRPGEDHEPICDWSEHTGLDGKKYYYNRKTGKSVWEKPQELKDFEQYARHQVQNEQDHSVIPRNDGVPPNQPIQGQLIQTRPSVVQQVPSQPVLGRSGLPLSAQDQQHVQNENIEEIQRRDNVIQLENISIISTSRINENMTIQPIEEVKIQVEIDMSTEQFISVGQALFRRNRHQND